MKKTIIVVASVGAELSTTFARMLAAHDIGCEVVNNVEAKNTINSINEPMIIKNYHNTVFTSTTKIKDLPRDKFKDKPRFNHRKF